MAGKAGTTARNGCCWLVICVLVLGAIGAGCSPQPSRYSRQELVTKLGKLFKIALPGSAADMQWCVYEGKDTVCAVRFSVPESEFRQVLIQMGFSENALFADRRCLTDSDSLRAAQAWWRPDSLTDVLNADSRDDGPFSRRALIGRDGKNVYVYLLCST